MRCLTMLLAFVAVVGSTVADCDWPDEKDPVKVRAWLQSDPMFDNLKSEAEFQALVAVQ